MKAIAERLKDPNASLDYAWDWSAWLADSEVITSAEVIVPDGLTKSKPDVRTASRVTGWLAGGVKGNKYTVTCHIVTNQGREDDRSIRLEVQDR